MPQPLEANPLDRDPSDPLLLFAAEPGQAATPPPPKESPPQSAAQAERPDQSSEIATLRVRAEAAERSLREARRTIVQLRREMATLVGATTNKPSAPSRRALALSAVVLAALVLTAAAAWQLTPVPAPVGPATAEQESVAPGADAAPVSPAPAAPMPIAASVPDTEPEPAPRVTSAAPVRRADLPVRESATAYVGTLSVDAVPDGGEVFINRKSVGKTPARISGLRAGSHLVWIQLAGYRRFTRVVHVPADKISRVSVALERDDTVAMRP